MDKFKSFLKEAGRVLRVTKKPNGEEYKTTLKVTSIGSAIIGGVGFIVFIINQLLF